MYNWDNKKFTDYRLTRNRKHKRGKVIQTRALVMPSGVTLVCRERITESGTEWTAEIPISIAVEIFAED